MEDRPYKSPSPPISSTPHRTVAPILKLASSFAILLYLLPPLGYRPSESETIFHSVLFAVGCYLVFAAIRDGRTLTRVFGLVILAPYGMFVLMMAGSSFENWSNISRYWFGR